MKSGSLEEKNSFNSLCLNQTAPKELNNKQGAKAGFLAVADRKNSFNLIRIYLVTLLEHRNLRVRRDLGYFLFILKVRKQAY